MQGVTRLLFVLVIGLIIGCAGNSADFSDDYRAIWDEFWHDLNIDDFEAAEAHLLEAWIEADNWDERDNVYYLAEELTRRGEIDTTAVRQAMLSELKRYANTEWEWREVLRKAEELDNQSAQGEAIANILVWEEDIESLERLFWKAMNLEYETALPEDVLREMEKAQDRNQIFDSYRRTFWCAHAAQEELRMDSAFRGMRETIRNSEMQEQAFTARQAFWEFQKLPEQTPATEGPPG